MSAALEHMSAALEHVSVAFENMSSLGPLSLSPPASISTYIYGFILKQHVQVGAPRKQIQMVHENRAVAFENMSAALETCQLKTCSQEQTTKLSRY